MKKISVLSVCFALVLLAGCTQAPTAQDVNTAPGAGTETKKEKINIGVIAPLSGPAATYGEDVSHGLKYVAKTINEAGGIDGQEINLIFEDGKCNGKDATTAVQKLINVDGVQAIAG